MRQYVVGLDFGYPKDTQQRSTIDDLAELIFRNYAKEAETVVLAQEFIYDMLRWYGFPRERLIEVGTGQSDTDGTKGGGSYHMLREAARMMRELECGTRGTSGGFEVFEASGGFGGRGSSRAFDGFGTRPLPDDLGPGRTWPPVKAILVAHALHVRRAVRQGRLFDVQLTPAEGLPTMLYRNAAQWWCRNRLAWYLREAIGLIPLRLAGQI